MRNVHICRTSFHGMCHDTYFERLRRWSLRSAHRCTDMHDVCMLCYSAIYRCLWHWQNSHWRRISHPSLPYGYGYTFHGYDYIRPWCDYTWYGYDYTWYGYDSTWCGYKHTSPWYDYTWLDMLLQSNLEVEDLAKEAMTSTTVWHNAVMSSASTALTSHTASSIRLTNHFPLLAVA